MGMAQPSGIPQMHGGSGALPQQLLLQQQALQAQQRHGLPQLGAQVSLPFEFCSLKWHTSCPSCWVSPCLACHTPEAGRSLLRCLHWGSPLQWHVFATSCNFTSLFGASPAALAHAWKQLLEALRDDPQQWHTSCFSCLPALPAHARVAHSLSPFVGVLTPTSELPAHACTAHCLQTCVEAVA